MFIFRWQRPFKWRRLLKANFYLLNTKGHYTKYFSTLNTSSKPGKVSPTIQKFFQKSYNLTKDIFYLGVVVGAFTVCGTVLFTIGKELWLENSLRNLVEKSNSKISSDSYVEDKLGSPLRFEYGSGARMPAAMISIDGETNLEKTICQYLVTGSRDKAFVQAEYINMASLDESAVDSPSESPFSWIYNNGLLRKSPIWKEHCVVLTSKSGAKYFVVPPPRSLSVEKQNIFQKSLAWIFSNKWINIDAYNYY